MTPPGVTPRCKTYGQTAGWDTPSVDTLLCDDGRCHRAYVTAEGFAIGYIEEESEGRQCKACGKAWVYLDEADVACRECGSGSAEMVGEMELMVRNRES